MGRGRFFDDFEAGEEFETSGRTITEADAVFWSYFTGDWNPVHVDEEFARTSSPFGTRLPPGLMSVAIGHGLTSQLGFLEGTGLAFLELVVRYKEPAHIGDTVHVRVRVAEKRPTSRPDRGLVKFDWFLVNQHGTVVSESTWLLLVARRRPEEGTRQP